LTGKIGQQKWAYENGACENGPAKMGLQKWAGESASKNQLAKIGRRKLAGKKIIFAWIYMFN